MTQEHPALFDKMRQSHTFSMLFGILCGAMIAVVLLDTFGLLRRGDGRHAEREAEESNPTVEAHADEGSVGIGESSPIRYHAGEDADSSGGAQDPL